MNGPTFELAVVFGLLFAAALAVCEPLLLTAAATSAVGAVGVATVSTLIELLAAEDAARPPPIKTSQWTKNNEVQMSLFENISRPSLNVLLICFIGFLNNFFIDFLRWPEAVEVVWPATDSPSYRSGFGLA